MSAVSAVFSCSSASHVLVCRPLARVARYLSIVPKKTSCTVVCVCVCVCVCLQHSCRKFSKCPAIASSRGTTVPNAPSVTLHSYVPSCACFFFFFFFFEQHQIILVTVTGKYDHIGCVPVYRRFAVFICGTTTYSVDALLRSVSG